jgi:hypoxanthine phosphoribosyltransferase
MDALDRMARALSPEFEGSRPLVLIVLTGGLYVGAALTQRLPFALDIDFVRVSRYGAGTEPGRLVWQLTPRLPLAGRSVLFIDDVWDEGLTLAGLVEWAVGQGAIKVRSAVLVHKEPPERPGGIVPVAGPDYFGLRAGRDWIVGWGMDLAGSGRHLPAIYVLPGGETLGPGVETP